MLLPANDKKLLLLTSVQNIFTFQQGIEKCHPCYILIVYFSFYMYQTIGYWFVIKEENE